MTSSLAEQIRKGKQYHGTYESKREHDTIESYNAAKDEDAKLVENYHKQLAKKLRDATDSAAYNDWSLLDGVIAELEGDKK